MTYPGYLSVGKGARWRRVLFIVPHIWREGYRLNENSAHAGAVPYKPYGLASGPSLQPSLQFLPPSSLPWRPPSLQLSDW